MKSQETSGCARRSHGTRVHGVDESPDTREAFVGNQVEVFNYNRCVNEKRSARRSIPSADIASILRTCVSATRNQITGFKRLCKPGVIQRHVVIISARSSCEYITD